MPVRSPRRLRWVTALVGAVTVVLSAAPAVAAAPGGAILGGQGESVADSYIVVLKNGRTQSAAPGLAHKYAGRVTRTYGKALNGFAVSMNETAAHRLAADDAVAYVERNGYVRASDTQTSPPSWGLDRIDQRTGTDDTYRYTTAAANVHAYVIDSGVRLTHQTFGGRAISGWDFVDNDADASDCQGHGTHVAGTVGGADYGVAKGVQLVSVRVLDCAGNAPIDRVIAGVDWVTAHAVRPAVANLSLGGPASQALDDAVKRSIDSGITYTIAAGNGDEFNNGQDACTVSPARLPDAITVSAIGKNDSRQGDDYRPGWANYGSCVDIFAPGVGIESAAKYFDVGSTSKDGTSMAAPHVAGAAALYLADHPAAAPAEVWAALSAASTKGQVADANGSPNALLYTSPPAEDFRVDLFPAAGTTAPGGALTSRVTAPPVEGRWQQVTASVSGAPAGVTATLSSGTLDMWTDSTLTIETTAAVAAGTYPLTVTAVGPSGTHTATYLLSVGGTTIGDFYFSAEKERSTVPGGTAKSFLAMWVRSGADQRLSFSATGVPPGATAAFTHTSGLVSEGNILTVTTSAATPAGTYPIVITAAGPGATHTDTFRLTVDAPPGCWGFNGTDASWSGTGSVTSPITVDGCGRSPSATADVEIHAPTADEMDMAFDLIAPDGTVVPVKAAGRGEDFGVDKRYTVDLSGKPANGTWQLRVTGAKWFLDGTLDSWALVL